MPVNKGEESQKQTLKRITKFKEMKTTKRQRHEDLQLLLKKKKEKEGRGI